MPPVNDNPNVIYVRGINEEELKAFQKIKEQFGYTSNNETIKKLFLHYVSLQESHDELKQENNKLKKKNLECQDKLSAVRDFARILKSL